jgi:hypothetical protein
MIRNFDESFICWHRPGNCLPDGERASGFSITECHAHVGRLTASESVTAPRAHSYSLLTPLLVADILIFAWRPIP